MKKEDLLLNTDESKEILKKIMSTHATPKNIAEYAMANADIASLKTARIIIDGLKLYKRIDGWLVVHPSWLEHIETLIKEIEDGNITKESK